MSLIDPSRQPSIRRFDDAVDQAFNHLRGKPAIDRLMYATTELGNFSLIWQILGVAQALRPKRSGASALRLAALIGIESAVVNGPIKMLFNRKRPVVDVDASPRPFRLRTPRTTSFPSGHATSGFFFAGVAGEDDDLAPLYYALAALVAASRVHVRIHHASDVTAGAVLGIVVARIARKAWPAPPPR